MSEDQENNEMPEEKAAVKDTQRNLREKLLQNLAENYRSELDENGTMPTVAIEGLVGLIHADGPTAADVLEALSKIDPSSEKGEDHE